MNSREVFRTVNGLEYPLALLCENSDGHHLPRMRGYQWYRTDGDKLENRSVSEGKSYEEELLLEESELLKILNEIAQRLGRVIKILDWGCGQGRALREILSFDCVDKNESFGVTLPHTKNIHPEVRNKIVQRSAHRVRPSIFHNFDVLISVFGINHYHPFGTANDGLFGLLQSMALTARGGYIIDPTSLVRQNPASPITPSYAQLLKGGYLRPASFECISPEFNPVPQITEVTKHPTPEEICRLFGY